MINLIGNALISVIVFFGFNYINTAYVNENQDKSVATTGQPTVQVIANPLGIPELVPTVPQNTTIPTIETKPQRPKEFDVNITKVSIPSMKIEAPIVPLNDLSDEGTRRALIGGVGRFPNGSEFGDIGNSIIFGHSSNLRSIKSRYNEIFRNLWNIKLGSEVELISGGVKYKYKVIRSFKVKPEDVWVLNSNPYNDDPAKSLLTLITCYPYPTTRERWIVVGELIN
jgi:LPXTG-site transpeptidase (sortase) family protein